MQRFIVYGLLILSPLLVFAQPDQVRRDFRRSENARFQLGRMLLQKTATPNQRNFDVTFYDLDLTLFPDKAQINGTIKITGRCLESGLDHIEIDLYANLQVDRVLSATGSPLSFSHSGELITIELGKVLAGGDLFNVEIEYHGNPADFTYRSFGWNTHGPAADPIIWTLSEPYGAPAWWPCKDDPADKADSVAINVTVPSGLVAASNGLLESITENGEWITYHWYTRYPISTYLVSLTVSNYARFSDWYRYSASDSMEITYFVYPEHLEKAKTDFDITADMMTFFASVFGEYPFLNEKYGMAIFPWGGGMEHQTITSYGAGLITGTHRYDWINAHELAHQWFGDCITMRNWSEIWLNEGFASYAEALWTEHREGKQAYLAYMDYMDYPPLYGPLFVSDSLNDGALFSRTVYDKGAWLLHMLRGVLGDDAFFTALKTYATHPALAYGNATADDFQRICETVSQTGLEWFFHQWIYRGDRPNYEVQWSVAGEQPYVTTVVITQTNSEPYKMPLPVRLTIGGEDTVVTVWDSLLVQQFEFRTGNAPESLEIDPDNWVMKNVTVTRVAHDLRGVPKLFAVSQNYPNPFNPVTRIQVSLPEKALLRLEVFNMLGERVYRESRERNEGFHTLLWNGNSSSGSAAPSGLYFYRISYPGHAITKKMLLLR